MGTFDTCCGADARSDLSLLKNGGAPRHAAMLPWIMLGCSSGGVTVRVHSEEAVVVLEAGSGIGVPH